MKKLIVERVEPPPPVPPRQSEDLTLRREPPVPVEPAAPLPPKPEKPAAPPEVVSKPSIPAHSIDPLPLKSKLVEELPPVAQVKDNVKAEEVVPKLKLDSPVPPETKPNIEPKKVDAIHEDAIAREESQLKEDDTLLKKEQDRKEQELFKKLKEHQEEQKQLLKEQQHILEEIKSRDGEPIPPKPVEPIEPQKFSDNIEKIQEVIDDLKERKQVIDKTKGDRIAEEKKKNAERKNNVKVMESPEKVAQFDQPSVALKSAVPSDLNLSAVPEAKVAVPLPLLKKQEQPDPVVAGRDILGVDTAPALDREKREAEDGSCSKTEKDAKSVKLSPNEGREPSADKPSDGTSEKIEEDYGIKESKIISAPIVADLRQTPSEEITGNSDKVEPKKISNLLPRREETRRKRRK